MRIAIVSDIHGNLPALQAVLADIARQGVDQIVNLGDLLSGPLLPAETADLLMSRGFLTLAGNHDRQLLALMEGAAPIDPDDSDGYAATQIQPRHVDWLRSLPPTHWLTPEVLLVHGTPASDLVYWLETVTPGMGRNGSPGVRAATDAEVAQRLRAGGPDAQQASLALCGHTHVPRVTLSGATLVVNPGSVGLPGYEDGYPHPHRIENGSPHARYALVERLVTGWLARLCSVPYDAAPMAALAAARGRHDWAHALATGRLPPVPPRRRAARKPNGKISGLLPPKDET
ncbi:MAG TPA: metallophosphoesterase family protein [Ramlibacter sp.]|nr:metallophosphoesterase family protein [Ramlibacter sp.]